MFTAILGLTQYQAITLHDWMLAHASEAYLQACYAGHIVSTLQLGQYFS